MQLQTITEEYRQLNRALHESDTPYGVYGFMHAQRVLDLRENNECETVLDYGCGKSTLRHTLASPHWLSEYDPAIPGKDARPEQADLVVCTDVLEHIEPELLDNVLLDIHRCTKKIAFLVIATRDSIKLLPDGTSPHKIIKDANWWRAKLSEKFYIADMEAHGTDDIALVVAPVRPVKEIRAKSAVSETIRFENAVVNCAKVKGRVFGDYVVTGTKNEALVPRHEGRVAIACFGPSLKDTWHLLKAERRAFGSKIVTVSGAHDFLIERGIVPDYHVEVDPREHKCHFTRTPHPDVTYWPSSCVHPALIENLQAHNSKVALWHLLSSDYDFKLAEPDGPDPGALLVCGGSGVGARTVMLFFLLGYRMFSIHGMDSSFADNDGKQHAGFHSGKIKPECRVTAGGRWFRSSFQMIYMARHMIEQVQMLNQLSKERGEKPAPGVDEHCECYFHGDGMLQHMIREGNRLGELKAA